MPHAALARSIAAITALSPPTAGLALIGIVAGDLGPSMITRSPAVAATALFVGALLVLGSAALYCWRSESFLAFSETFTGHLREIEEEPPAPGSVESAGSGRPADRVEDGAVGKP